MSICPRVRGHLSPAGSAQSGRYRALAGGLKAHLDWPSRVPPRKSSCVPRGWRPGRLSEASAKLVGRHRELPAGGQSILSDGHRAGCFLVSAGSRVSRAAPARRSSPRSAHVMTRRADVAMTGQSSWPPPGRSWRRAVAGTSSSLPRLPRGPNHVMQCGSLSSSTRSNASGWGEHIDWPPPRGGHVADPPARMTALAGIGTVTP